MLTPRIVIAAGALLLGTSISAGQANAARCENVLRAKSDPKFTKLFGKPNAIKAWEDKAGRRDGAAYASWKNAKDQNVTCDKADKLKQVCTASARPCYAPK